MADAALVARFAPVDSDPGPGARIRARRISLGLKAGKLALLADVSREHLSAVENGHNDPSAEWVRSVELAMDRYAHETGQDEPEAETAPAAGPKVMRVEVQGVYGAKALVFEAPVENIAELEAMVDRVMRRLADQDHPAAE